MAKIFYKAVFQCLDSEGTWKVRQGRQSVQASAMILHVRKVRGLQDNAKPVILSLQHGAFTLNQETCCLSL